VVLILIDEAGAQSCLGMGRHYLSRKINSHVHSSSFHKTEKEISASEMEMNKISGRKTS